MARFRGTIQGQRGEASRLGSAKSCLTVEANGWDIGVRVVGRDVDGKDVFGIYVTGGSNGRFSSDYLGCVTLTNDGPMFTPADSRIAVNA